MPIAYSKHVKAAGIFSMRHSHQDTDSTWKTTWFSEYWRQRFSSTVKATNAAFVIRILQRVSVFKQDGPSIAKAQPYPRFYNYEPYEPCGMSHGDRGEIEIRMCEQSRDERGHE